MNCLLCTSFYDSYFPSSITCFLVVHSIIQYNSRRNYPYMLMWGLEYSEGGSPNHSAFTDIIETSITYIYLLVISSRPLLFMSWGCRYVG